ncbi:MAG: hypothetical protein JNK72_23440 [Myxococcales bacterium]|nr:hypothetical protein [Myxococcales bacterium]
MTRYALVFALLTASCSIDFDGFLRNDLDAGEGPRDAGQPPTDLGNAPTDTGNAPTDTGNVPTDTGNVPTDTGNAPTDTGNAPTDTGVVVPTRCAAPYLVVLAHNLDNGRAELLRWSYAAGQSGPCANLPIDVSHPIAMGLAFDNLDQVTGPQLIVANANAVYQLNVEDGSLRNMVSAEGTPRSIFDLVSNGSGTFAVSYSFTGDTGNPGQVGLVRVFNHRQNLRLEQTWMRGSTFGQNVVSMTAFPGNQGQYLTLRSPMSNNTYSAFVTSPFSGAHSLNSTAIIADRNFARSMYAYRTADRIGHYAMALGADGMTPYVSLHTASGVSSSTVTNAYLTTLRCSGLVCPKVTRAAAAPDDPGAGAAICEESLTQYRVVRFGGASSGCAMLDTAQMPGRWRLEDLVMVPR